MAITVSNIAMNHRSIYFEYTGDGVVVAPTVKLSQKFTRPNTTASAFGVTGATSLNSKSNRGGLNFPEGTAIAITSCSVSATGLVTVTTTAAVANGTKAYMVVVLDQPGD